ncbi:alkaline phosphatase [Lentzea sp. NBRC 105346]|uniref:alkaline phosphatase D family protein n=1 Tax=Lentzea sp. NBRC 105346 TaxID=3032205 RepID=UPI0024A2B27A|nr:alkaline phosphatase D family protein [Lentzea sp. NBRC 105346]GLZ34258.1 alkaline phosphatase [Lentzea sp. NBRC 105346]
MAKLVLGPLLRHVGDTTATVWVETDERCTVTVAGHSVSTFQVGEQHFALVRLRDLGPRTEYDVRLDGEVVWPLAGDPYPKPTIRTKDVKRILFGSCRAAKHDVDKLGRDALDAYATRMAQKPEDEWPDAMLLLGDQVYADEPTDAAKRWLREHRHGTDEPADEVVHFAEYAHLYLETWSDPEIRWMMSTVPSSMIFDDHDVRDDWNTSYVWREHMKAKPWWRDRIRGALSSYWVYQHIGNLGPDDLDSDPLFKRVQEHGGDVLPLLEDFAEEADRESGGRKPMRWSYRRDFDRIRLLVIDTRSGRILEDGRRSMVGDDEFEWIEENAAGDFDHLLIGSSLPWLMPHALSHFQSLNEIGAAKAGWQGRAAERIRQVLDLEHWPAFRQSFDRLTRLVQKAASGVETVCVLSGDVHHSYVAEAEFPVRTRGRALQLVCSPVRNEPPGFMLPAFRLAWSRTAARLLRKLASLAGVPEDLMSWRKLTGPHFGNSVGLLEFDGDQPRFRLESADGQQKTSVLLGREP